MTSLPMQYYGSFQTGTNFDAEDPLEEVWSQIAHVGTHGFWRASTPVKPGSDWERHRSYAVVRIAQCMEFRRACASGTILTRPLLLYYSFLNMVRAVLALGPETMSAKGHGLRFHSAARILDARAEVCGGTFTEYLDFTNTPWSAGQSIDLKTCLSRIVELTHPFSVLGVGPSQVLAVDVHAQFDGQFWLDARLPEELVQDFRDTWQQRFPGLKEVCALEPGGCRLRVMVPAKQESWKEVQVFCGRHLLPQLVLRDDPVWFFLPQPAGELWFPRDGYYMAAMFILGSAVRYEPEMVLECAGVGSQLGWCVGRLIAAAERYFPQLVLERVYGNPVYF